MILSSSEVRLKCESSDTPSISVAYWTHIGQRIEVNPSIIEIHGNELRLFQFGDTAYTQPGAYACVVSTRYGLLESEPAMLSLPSKSLYQIMTDTITFHDLLKWSIIPPVRTIVVVTLVNLIPLPSSSFLYCCLIVCTR